MNLRSIVAVLLLLAVVACSEPLEFADWTIPVPEGTRVIEYAGVPLEGRTQQIQLVEDLVVGGKPDDPNYAFYRATDVTVDENGHIYVADAGNHRVQVFTADGRHLRTLGKEGEGPGEFRSPIALIVVGETLLVWDSRNVRFSLWDSAGRHQADHRVPAASRDLYLVGPTPTGNLLTYYAASDGSDVQSLVLAVFTQGAEVARRLLELPFENTPTVQRGTRRMFSSVVPRDRPSFAASKGGRTYVTAGDEYQVLALPAAGEASWALRVAWERTPFSMSDEDEEWTLGILRRSFPDLTSSEVNWPDYLPTISELTVDGHGHLYVHLYNRSTDLGVVGPRPVDVYSSEGEHVFSGMMPGRSWSAAHGDYVYSLGRDPDNGEQVVARYQLVEPF